MLSIFRKNKDKIKKEGKDSTISSEEILNETEESTETEIETELSFHPAWNVPAEQTYVYRFLNNELPPLKPNQISLSGIELKREEDGLVAVAFVRNSLSKAIRFEEVQLLLLDAEKQLIARNTFNLSELGELPARSSRPWFFKFPIETLVKQEFANEGWTLAFELKKKHQLDLHESWEQSLGEDQKVKLKQVVEKLGAPQAGEINFMGLQAAQAENGDLHATILIRNGTNKNIQIQQLPLELRDASNEVVAKGGFQLKDFEVKANTTKPWTFIFPKQLLTKEEIDLSKWKVSTTTNKTE
jgi:accessory Sec system S-layer assembly protein